MDPQNNQSPMLPGSTPSQQSPQLPDPEQTPVPFPAMSPAVPDWQQGLGVPPVQPTPPGPAIPGPAQPGPIPQSGVGGPVNMPAAQPGPWASPAGNAPPSVSSYVPEAPAPSLPATMPSDIPIHDPIQARNRAPLLIAIVLAVVLIIAGATYVAFFRKDKTAEQTATESPTTASAEGPDLAAQDHATFILPDNIPGYTARGTGVAAIHDYVSADGNCELIVGTVSVSQLPGANLDAIIQPQLKQLKDAGARVDGPTSGGALLLKDEAGKTTYRLPTLNFAFTQDTKHASVHYSAVILKSTDRAVINRTCVNKNGQVDVDKLDALDAIAGQIKVSVAAP